MSTRHVLGRKWVGVMKFDDLASAGFRSGGAVYGVKSRDRFRTPLDFVMRRGERTVFSFDTTLSNSAFCEQSIRVINFSEFGFLAALEDAITPGAAVILKLKNIGDVSGRVVWAKGPLAGGRFDKQIDVNRLVKVLENEQSL